MDLTWALVQIGVAGKFGRQAIIETEHAWHERGPKSSRDRFCLSEFRQVAGREKENGPDGVTIRAVG